MLLLHWVWTKVGAEQFICPKHWTRLRPALTPAWRQHAGDAWETMEASGLVWALLISLAGTSLKVIPGWTVNYWPTSVRLLALTQPVLLSVAILNLLCVVALNRLFLTLWNSLSESPGEGSERQTLINGHMHNPFDMDCWPSLGLTQTLAAPRLLSGKEHRKQRGLFLIHRPSGRTVGQTHSPNLRAGWDLSLRASAQHSAGVRSDGNCSEPPGDPSPAWIPTREGQTLQLFFKGEL